MHRIIHHVERGQGIPLVLLHGFPFDHTLWLPQLEELTDAARMIAPDLRGFGGSHGVPEVMTMEDHARDVKALLDRLGIERAVICGLSMGGYIALAFAELFPEAMRGLILCNTRAVPDGPQARKGRYATAKRAMEQGVGGIADSMTPRLIARASADRHPDLVHFVHALIAHQPAEAVAASARGMALRPDRSSMLASISAPTLIITGSADELIPPTDSDAMARAIPGSVLVTLPGVGHLTNLEDPEGFNAAVRGVLEQVA